MRQSEIPETVMTAIDNYVEYGYHPGHFCEAVLQNNLQKAFWYADDRTKACMEDIINYVENVVPPEARGNADCVRTWKGLLEASRKDPRCD
jgi:hypothetical protein